MFDCTIAYFFYTAILNYWANDGEKTQIIENMNNLIYFVGCIHNFKIYVTFLAKMSFILR